MQTLPRMQRTLGYNHPYTAECYEGLALIEMHSGRHDEALRLLQSAVRANPLRAARIADNSAFTPLKGTPEYEDILAKTGPKE